MRYIVFGSAALGLVLLYLLSLASTDTATSGEYYKVLLYLNVAMRVDESGTLVMCLHA